MNVRILTDSEPTLESIASTKQIERKALRMVVQEMKEKLRNGDITSDQWVSTKEIWPDGLTKCLTLEIEKLGGQVIVKGQENPLTGGKRNRKKLIKNFNVRHKKSVVA